MREPQRPGAHFEQRAALGLYALLGLLLAGVLTALVLQLTEAAAARDASRSALAATRLARENGALIRRLVDERGLGVLVASDAAPDMLDDFAAATAHTDRQWDRLTAETTAILEDLTPRVEEELTEDVSLRSGALVAGRNAVYRRGSPEDIFTTYTGIVRSLADTMWVTVTSAPHAGIERRLLGLAILGDHLEATGRERLDLALSTRTRGEERARLGATTWESQRQDVFRRLLHLLPTRRTEILALQRTRESDAFEALLQAPAGERSPVAVFQAGTEYLETISLLAEDIASALEIEAEEAANEAQLRFETVRLALLSAVALALVTGVVVWRTQRQRQRVESAIASAQREFEIVVGDLQREMLPEAAPPLPEIEAVMRYEPAAAHAQIGGDWYDLFEIEEGVLTITMGDAFGHGVEAVVAMEQVRQAIRTLSHERTDPADVLATAHRILTRFYPRGEVMATVWHGILDLASGRLRFSSWGHPPPVLVEPNGAFTRLEDRPNPPLGTPGNHVRLPASSVLVRPDSVLLLYTDGLIEGREVALDDGLARASKEVEANLSRPLDEIADLLLEMRPDPGRDDAALVLVRIRETLRLEVWADD